MRLKAFAEIYTMHYFAQLCNLIFLSNFANVFSKFKSQNPIEAFLQSLFFKRNTCFLFEVQWRRRTINPPGHHASWFESSLCLSICLSRKDSLPAAPLKTALSRCVYYGCASDLHLYQTSLTKYILAKCSHTGSGRRAQKRKSAYAATLRRLPVLHELS